MIQLERNGMDTDLVLYIYKCTECGHAGRVHLPGDEHDSESTNCKVCGSTVSLEWDGGVVFDVGMPFSPTT